MHGETVEYVSLKYFESFSTPPVLMCSSLFTIFIWTAYCLILFWLL